MISSLADRIEISLVGKGGQGMILAGMILAEAASIYDHKNTVQTQTYGPEARGGASKSEVVISSGEIDHPEVINADILVALSQEACDKYSPGMKEDSLSILDEENIDCTPATPFVRVPITRLALETTGRVITANTVALGVLVGLTEVVSRQSIEKAVLARAPRGTRQLNRSALLKGFEAAEALKMHT
ncbi:MAG: 2-oxoacid:acceptor oxidoreductase family protein [Anaerolineae bacterium]|nr:2-oxoacid:acceptor oxidoreductase family protein [Anaerolineae bacterium]